MRFWLALIFIGSAPSFATAYVETSASDCSPIDLRKDFPLQMRDQGDIGWCYANTAADYLQFHYRIPEMISAADIAISYNLERWPRLYQWFTGREVPETGFIRSALKKAVQEGYCPESYLPSDQWVKETKSGNDFMTEKKTLLASIEDLFSLQDGIQEGLYKSVSDLPYIFRFKMISDLQFFSLLGENSHQSLLNALRLAACEGHRKEYPSAIGRIGMALKGRKAFVRIHRYLEMGSPVSVDYFYGFLHSDDYVRSVASLHTSLIMGRHLNEKTGECQYLIKNSRGDHCEEYDDRHTCEHGYVWVDESAFYPAMLAYEFIKNVDPQTADDLDDQSLQDDL